MIEIISRENGLPIGRAEFNRYGGISHLSGSREALDVIRFYRGHSGIIPRTSEEMADWVITGLYFNDRRYRFVHNGIVIGV